MSTMTRSVSPLLRMTLTSFRPQFVYPRINPVRKDVAVMTHESEIVNVWEGRR
jgi:hypothetical protein